MIGRWAPHLIGLLSIAFIAGALWFFIPDIAEEPADWFSYLSGWATLYGVFVALFEVRRAATAAEARSSGAIDASARFNQIRKSRDLAECKSGIDVILEQLDEQKSVSSKTLTRLISGYSANFSEEYEDDASEVRRHCLVIRGYIVSKASPSLRDSSALRGAMSDMAIRIENEINGLSVERQL